MKWSEEYSTGFKMIDEQHKMIFKMSEEFHAVLDEGLGEKTFASLLESLHLYVRAHFGIEEDCMFRTRCPAYQRNNATHREFEAALTEFRHEYEKDGYEEGRARVVVTTVEQWLTDHICRIDIQLKGLNDES